MMMELGHKSTSFSPTDLASTSGFSELTAINAEQLATILLSQSYDCTVLDCRPPGTHPTIRCAHPIFLPTVLLRRLNNGTISPTSISPLLCDADRKVIIVPDSMQSNSLAARIFDTLVRRQYTVAFLNGLFIFIHFNSPYLFSSFSLMTLIKPHNYYLFFI
uniref:Rhodanese domain-containing protein n=1 Tax=Panagrolaimus davidi TaxID=227884 RepID=A0A914R1D9_9BILA